jgi:hypothetical protein
MKKILLAMLCAVFGMNLYGSEVTRNGITRRVFEREDNGVVNVIRLYKKGNIEVRPCYTGNKLDGYFGWRLRMCRRSVGFWGQEAQELYMAFEKEFNEQEKNNSLSQMIKRACCSRKKKD